ncbi:carboxypeptidase-like regulatory domain-containing protein [Paraburkholderia caribensis]|uniref:carboxypeptidase-like regulatory domain-containing protein n=1 Tax=Paraburkholderia caribensis TaxID=75105 RepID=UPI001591E10E|nr:carboxypeptidase-like regulatory domain-containing protein [Paraburkholderia caribensis]
MNTFTKAGLVAVALVFAQSATSVAFAAPANLPPLHQQGAVAYLSGGVGSDQSAALKEVMHTYPLTLEFTGATRHGNEYLADVPVHIADMNGKTLLNATSDGPFMLASLPDGRYTVTASHDGKTQQRIVDVKSSGHVRAMFVWPTPPEGSTS